MPTYYAPNLNRIPNAFYIRGLDLPNEQFESTAIFNYSVSNANWTAARSAVNGQVDNRIVIQNRFSSPNYTIIRTGIQFSTTWGIVPVGMYINFTTDGGGGFPFKIRAFKGTTSALTGATSEYSIPLNQGLVPFSEELEVTEVGEINLYFNQTAVDAFLSNPNQNVFILGEYDYNNIEPTTIYNLANSEPSSISLLTGQE